MCQKTLTHICQNFEWLGSNMAPVRNVLCYQQIAIPGNENWDFSHFSTKLVQILNGQLLNFLCYLYKGTFKNFFI